MVSLHKRWDETVTPPGKPRGSESRNACKEEYSVLKKNDHVNKFLCLGGWKLRVLDKQ